MNLRLCITISLMMIYAIFAYDGWERIYGDENVERSYDIIETSTYDLIVVGSSEPSLDARGNVLIFSVNSDGDTVFVNEYDFGLDDAARAITTSHDGNYVICGHSNSFGEVDDYDVLIMKINPDGDTLWLNTIGIPNTDDWGLDIEKTRDGGYIICGSTESFPDTINTEDIYVIKTDSEGDTIWTNYYRGLYNSKGYDIEVLPFGGYIVCGITQVRITGSNEIYLVKIDEDGEMVWSEIYGTSDNHDEAYAMTLLDDGNFIIAGATQSWGADMFDCYIMKLDSTGSEIWSRLYGGSNQEWASDIKMLDDGSFVISGWTSSYTSGGSDAYLFKVDGAGDLIWQKNYGGANNDFINAFVPLHDDGFALAGYSYSYSADRADAYIVKVDSVGSFGYLPFYEPFEVKIGWNTFSYPFTNTMVFDEVFDMAIPPCYSYDTETGGYISNDSLKAGIGYWLLSPIDSMVWVGGYEYCDHVTDTLKRGWNLIGVPADTILASTIGDLPEIIPPIYTFNPESRAYDEIDNFVPGFGYWILSRSEIIIELP